MLKLTSTRRRLVWAALITVAVWTVGYVIQLYPDREYVVISEEQAPLSVTGSEFVVSGLEVVVTFVVVAAALWFVQAVRDVRESRQQVD